MTDELPRWDVSTYFPSLDSPELSAATERIGADVARLGSLFDAHNVRAVEGVSAAEAAGAVEEVIQATNEVLEHQELVGAYLYSHVSTDSRDTRASSLYARLQQDSAPLRPLTTRFEAWVDSLGVDELVEHSDIAADHAWPLRKSAQRAAHQMTEDQEDLAAELNLTGAGAWSRLYSELSSQVTATVSGEVLPVTAVRNLAHDRSAAVREEAYHAELAAWESQSVTFAACLNGVKGQSIALNRRRGYTDELTPVLQSNAVSASTLAAMQRAVQSSLPDFRRYLGIKARLLGHGDGVLPWWDLFAPVGEDTGGIPWAQAIDQVRTSFASFSPRLAGLVDRAVAESWIDVGPREGKVGGAFCMGIQGDASRVLLNYGGTLDSVSTLAHELGHAYHNSNLAGRTPIQRATPMALAETASIFCETILVQSMLRTADGAQRLVLLETDLLGATQVVVDIHSRFLFESALCERRERGPLSVEELCRLMTDAQRQTYGEALDPEALHPYMWAVKPHYYGRDFYNWPYTFGLLFGLGLYARYTSDPEAFLTGYDDLLSSTGLGEAAELAARFGIDVEDEAFWASSLDVLKGRIDELERLVTP